MTIKATDKQCDKAQKLLEAFLEAMPELTIDIKTHPQERKIVDECYNGDVRKYILESFGNFLDQVI